MKINMPDNVSFIINRLVERGFEAYAVGGCVRDTLLGKEPEDWDITTSAKPMEIKSSFHRTIDTGIQHGTVTVMIDGTGYEVTTYRIDGEYEDGRHPKQVDFTDSLRLDLERRDFTINAMAYNDVSGLVDCFGGKKDLEDGIIRCVGDADERFNEDALRILRAVRFSGQFGFDIEYNTRHAMKKHAVNLRKISAERIRVELIKLLTSKDSGKLMTAWETGMTAVFLPEFDIMMDTAQHNPHHIFSVGEHSIRCVEMMNYFFGRKGNDFKLPDIIERRLGRVKDYAKTLAKKTQSALCLTMLLHDCAKPSVMKIDEFGVGHFNNHPQEGDKMAYDIMRRLTFDNDTIRLVRLLILYHDYRIQPDSKSVRRAAAKIGSDNMCMLFLVQYADVLGQNPDTYTEKFDRIDCVWDLFEEAEKSRMPLCLTDLAVNGNDLIKAGIKPGPKLGEILYKLLDYVIECPEGNNYSFLIDMAVENYGNLLEMEGGKG